MSFKLKHMSDDKLQSIDSSIAFHSILASRWSNGYSSGRFRRRIEFFKSKLKELVQVGSHWLDAGCGSGVLAREIGALGADVIAIDASDEMINCAKKEHLPSIPILYKQVATIEKIDNESGIFDGVLCSSVIEYIDNPCLALKELIRVTKPGGVLILSVPSKLSLIRLFQKIIRKCSKIFGKNRFFYLEFSINSYTRRGLFFLLESSGYLVDKIDIFDPILPIFSNRLSFGSLFVVVAHKPMTFDSSCLNNESRGGAT